MKSQILLGDCLDVLKTLPDASLDAAVLDPPYGLGTREPTADEIIAYLQGARLDTSGDFMGHKWDIPSVAVWREIRRVLKPGAHMLVFGGTRTWDLISLGIRAAGFECRDTIASNFGVSALQWVQGQGFAKSRNPLIDIAKMYGDPCICCSLDPRNGSASRNQERPADSDTASIESPTSDLQTSAIGNSACGSNGLMEGISGPAPGHDVGSQASSETQVYAGGSQESAPPAVHRAVVQASTQDQGVLDAGSGCASGDNARSNPGKTVGVFVGLSGGLSSKTAQDTTLEGSPATAGHSMQGLQADLDGISFAIPNEILLEEVPQRGAAPSRHRHAPVRSRLEEDERSGSSEGQGVSCLPQDATGQRGSTSGPPSQTLSLPRDESVSELGSAVQQLPSSNRVSHKAGVGFDTDRSKPRQLISYSPDPGRLPDARVCSWCGRPDPGWLSHYAGLGTNLKPAFEPVLVFRKPIAEKTVALQVLRTGTGTLNIDGCRVRTAPKDLEEMKGRSGASSPNAFPGANSAGIWEPKSQGRWPSNLVFVHSEGCTRVGTQKVDAPVINRFVDGAKPFGNGAGHAYESEQRGDAEGKEEIAVYNCQEGCPVKTLDEQSGHQVSGTAYEPDGKPMNRSIYGATNTLGRTLGYGDAGGASRYFPQFDQDQDPAYECEEGCPIKALDDQSGVLKTSGGALNRSGIGFQGGSDGNQDYVPPSEGGASRFFPQFEQLEAPFMYATKVSKSERDAGLPKGTNNHPCVKPQGLMRWLCRLVTQKGGTILDPYCGSGSTLVAALKEGFNFIGIERDPEFHRIAEMRVAANTPKPDIFDDMEDL